MIRKLLSRLPQLLGGENSLRQQLLRGSFWSAVIKVSHRLLVLAIAILLSRQLGAEDYGKYSFAWAWFSPMMILTTLGYHTLLIREVAASDATGDWSLMRGVILRSLQTVAVTSVILLTVGLLVLQALEGRMDESQRLTILLVLLLVPFSAVRQLLSGVLKGLQFVVSAQFLNFFLRPIVTLIALAALVLFFDGVESAQMAMGVMWFSMLLLAILTVWLAMYRLPRAAYHCQAIYRGREWLKSSFALSLVSASTAINSQMDILMLGFLVPSRDVGIYSIATHGASLVIFGLQITGTMLAPQFARLFRQGEHHRLHRLSQFATLGNTLIALPFFLLFLFAGGDLAAWVFGDDFYDSYSALVILSFAHLLNAMLGTSDTLLQMSGHEKSVARAYLYTAILNVILNLLLIPLYGIEGAAVATAISIIIRKLFLLQQTQKHLQINTLLTFKLLPKKP